jgi:FtsX-like permease family
MGGGIGWLAAKEIRQRWVATVATVVLVGFVGAIVFATVAGARRSDSSLRRFNAESGTTNLELNIGTASGALIKGFEQRAHVTRVGVIRVFGITVLQRPNVSLATDENGTWGTVVDRPRVIKGRLPDPRAPDEVTIGEAFAKQTGLSVGGVIDTLTLTPEQVAQGSFDPVPTNPHPRLRIVGIVRRPVDLSDLAAGGGIVTLTRAFGQTYRNKIVSFALDLRIAVPGGPADIARVRAVAVRTFAKDDQFRVLDPTAENTGAQDAIDVLTTALWIFAAVAAIAGLFAIGIVVVRDFSRVRPQQATWRALGLTRNGRAAVSIPRAVVVSVGGPLLAVAGAIVLSPLFPFGVARRADPDVGVHADWFVLGLGALALFALMCGLIAVTAVRAARVDLGDARPRRSAIDAIAVAHLRPTVANGVRMAFDPGRDARAVPLRSAFAGAALGVLGVTAVLVFASSLGRLADTPRLYGWTWDAKVRDIVSPTRCNANTNGLDRVKDVGDVGAVCYSSSVIDGRDTSLWSFTGIRGTFAPTIVAGREPIRADEVAMGRDALDAVHKQVGDTVRVDGGKGARTFRVVGRTVFPPLVPADAQHLADGAVVTPEGYALVHQNDTDESGSTTRFVLLRFDREVSIGTLERRVLAIPAFAKTARAVPFNLGDAIGGPDRPPEIDRLRTTGWIAPVLAILMSVLALIGVAQALITTARRRRHELAVLKALGFDRRQVRATLAWQATTLAVVGLVVGVPLGIVVGRFAWLTVADKIGVGRTVVVPVLAVAVLVPATVVLVNLVAALPARVASRTRTSVALAAE